MVAVKDILLACDSVKSGRYLRISWRSFATVFMVAESDSHSSTLMKDIRPKCW